MSTGVASGGCPEMKKLFEIVSLSAFGSSAAGNGLRAAVDRQPAAPEGRQADDSEQESDGPSDVHSGVLVHRREFYDEARPSARAPLDPHPPVVLVHVLSDDGQTKPGAVAESPEPARRAPREPLEDPVPLLGRDAWPGVLDEETNR